MFLFLYLTLFSHVLQLDVDVPVISGAEICAEMRPRDTPHIPHRALPDPSLSLSDPSSAFVPQNVDLLNAQWTFQFGLLLTVPIICFLAVEHGLRAALGRLWNVYLTGETFPRRAAPPAATRHRRRRRRPPPPSRAAPRRATSATHLGDSSPPLGDSSRRLISRDIGAPFFFMFHMGTKAHYFDSTLKFYP